MKRLPRRIRFASSPDTSLCRCREGTLALQQRRARGPLRIPRRARDQLGPTRRRSRRGRNRQSHRGIGHIRNIDLEIKGTWGAYDLEWMREFWMSALRRGLDGIGKAGGGTILMDADRIRTFIRAGARCAIKSAKLSARKLFRSKRASIPTRPKFPNRNTGRSPAKSRLPGCGAWARRASTAAAASALSTCAC